jgi:hypothetical protein
VGGRDRRVGGERHKQVSTKDAKRESSPCLEQLTSVTTSLIQPASRAAGRGLVNVLLSECTAARHFRNRNLPRGCLVDCRCINTQGWKGFLYVPFVVFARISSITNYRYLVPISKQRYLPKRQTCNCSENQSSNSHESGHSGCQCHANHAKTSLSTRALLVLIGLRRRCINHLREIGL